MIKSSIARLVGGAVLAVALAGCANTEVHTFNIQTAAQGKDQEQGRLRQGLVNAQDAPGPGVVRRLLVGSQGNAVGKFGGDGLAVGQNMGHLAPGQPEADTQAEGQGQEEEEAEGGNKVVGHEAVRKYGL